MLSYYIQTWHDDRLIHGIYARARFWMTLNLNLKMSVRLVLLVLCCSCLFVRLLFSPLLWGGFFNLGE